MNKCDNCLLGAPSIICWEVFCPNYLSKKEKEREWELLINDCIKQVRTVYESKRNN